MKMKESLVNNGPFCLETLSSWWTELLSLWNIHLFSLVILFVFDIIKLYQLSLGTFIRGIYFSLIFRFQIGILIRCCFLGSTFRCLEDLTKLGSSWSNIRTWSFLSHPDGSKSIQGWCCHCLFLCNKLQ